MDNSKGGEVMSSLDAIAVNIEAATGNVPPLLHEIRHALKRLALGEAGTSIDLRGLPLAPGEEERTRASGSSPIAMPTTPLSPGTSK